MSGSKNKAKNFYSYNSLPDQLRHIARHIKALKFSSCKSLSSSAFDLDHLKSKRQNPRCLLVANGPSARLLTPRHLDSYDLITCSTSFKNKSLRDASILFHVEASFHPPFTEPEFVREYSEAISNSANLAQAHFLFSIANSNDLYLKMLDDSGMILGISCERFSLLDYSCSVPSKSFSAEPRLFSPLMYTPRSVSHTVLSILIALDYREIMLVGFDQTRILEYFKNSYDYSVDPTKGQQAAASMMRDISLSRMFYNSFLTFRQFEFLADVASSKCISVQHAFPGSWACMFPLTAENL